MKTVILTFIFLTGFGGFACALTPIILPNIGNLISEAEIQKSVTYARIETDKMMCSPAFLTGIGLRKNSSETNKTESFDLKPRKLT